jgi:putative ABC transport system permease protein
MRDVAVRPAPGDLEEHLALALGQAVELVPAGGVRCGGGEVGDQSPSDLGRDQALPTSDGADRAEQRAWVNYLMIGALMAFVAIAAMNSLAMAVGERAGELALLRLVGAIPRQVIRTIRWEALAVIGFGVVVGLAVAAATLVPFSLAIAETAIPHLPWHAVAGVITGALLLGLGAHELPARHALRRDPLYRLI